MTFKKYYLTTTLVAILGILVSIAFFPTRTDTPLMYFYDKQYEKAYVYYKELYENGNRSMTVVIPLARILLEYAQEEEAIKIMEEYVENHPQSVDARKYLGKIYFDAHRSYDYLENLERIYNLSPSAEVLREKEKFYGYVGDTKAEVESLEEIMAKYRPLEQEYLELSYRYASEGNTAQAIEILNRFLAEHPIDKMDSATAEFAIDLLASQGKTDKAVQLALDYQKVHPDLEVTLGLVSSLHKAELYREGRKLLDNLDAESKNQPSAILARVGLLLSEEHTFLAYEYLLNQFAQQNLPTTLFKDFLLLAIEYRDFPVLENLIEAHVVDRMPESHLIKIIHETTVHQHRYIIEALSKVLDEEYLTSHFPVAMALMLADPEISHFEKIVLSQFYETETLSNSNKALLAGLCSDLGYNSVAKKILEQVDTFEDVPNREVEMLAHLFLKYSFEEKGWGIIEEAFSKNPSNKTYERAWVLLGCGVGESDAILPWLQSQEKVNESLLQDAFYIAYEKKQASLSMHLANALYNLKPSKKNKQYIGKALLLNGYVEKAYKIFDELLSAGENVAEPFATTLIMLAAQDDSYHDKLQGVVAQFLADKTISETILRNMGYLLIDKKFTEQAEATFSRLVEGKKYNDPDVQTLLGLWGEKPAQKKVDWVAAKAKASEGAEKGQWLGFLLGTKNYDEVLTLVDRAEWEEDEIVDLYVKALIFTKREKELKDVIAYVIPQEGRLPRLRQYGKIASGEGLTSIATTVYKKILQVHPGDDEALLALGGICYSDGEYCEAKKYLRDYFQESGDNHLGYYYCGEISLFEKMKHQARDFFRQSLRLIRELESSDKYTKSIEAHLLHRLNCSKAAIALYDALLKENPDNLYLWADLANVLIDTEHFHAAENLLFCHNPQSEEMNAEIALTLARIRYLKEVHCYKRALYLSKACLEEYQDSQAAMASRADVEFSVGRWRRALHYMKKASYLQPSNEVYRKAQDEIRVDHLPEIALKGEYRKTGDVQDEVFFDIRSSVYICPFTLLSLEVETDTLELDTVNADGKVLEANKYDRYRAEVVLSHDFLCGNRMLGSLYYGPHTYGCGLLTELLDFKGKTSFVTEYHHPNWDFTQTTIDYGTRDMIGVSRIHQLARRLQGSLGLSYNRYNLKGFESAATSYAVESQLLYSISPNNPLLKRFGDDFILNLNYSLDAEYSSHIRKTKDDAGNTIQPLLLTSREVHSGTLFMSKRFCPSIAFEGYGGYSYDAIARGKSVPIYGANLIFGRKEYLESRMTYSHSTSTQFTTTDVDRFIVDIHYKW